MLYDKEIWQEEKMKRCAHFKDRKLPTAFLKHWQIEEKTPEAALGELANKLLHIEETFVIEPDIWIKYDSDEGIIGWIESLEGLYQIILSPIEDEKHHTFFSLYLFRACCPCPMLDIRVLLESLDTEIWQALVDNAPPLHTTARANVEWFMRQSRGIKACLDQFYRARSYGKAYGYLIAVFSFMENIYHFVHRLHIAELSTNLHNDELGMADPNKASSLWRTSFP